MNNIMILKTEISQLAGVITFVFVVLLISLAGITGGITSDELFTIAVGVRFLMAIFLAYSVRRITKMFLDFLRPDEI